MVDVRQYYFSSKAICQTVDSVRTLHSPSTSSDTDVLCSGVPQGYILGPVLFLLFIIDLPLTWKGRNALFADDATLYAGVVTLIGVQVLLRRDLSNTTWTKDHGMAANPRKTKYMIVGTRKKLSRCEEWALSLWLHGR